MLNKFDFTSIKHQAVKQLKLDMTKVYKFTLCCFFAVTLNLTASAQSTIAAKFDTVKLEFKGTKVQQAKYLLRYVKKYAHLGDSLSTLPPFIDLILNDKVKLVAANNLQRYLDEAQISPLQIGGLLTNPIASVEGKQASYFVIHDTSNFLKDSTAFPNNIDSVSWRGNKLDNKLTFKYTHLFINRMGESITSNDMSLPVRGTKFENTNRNPAITKNILGNFIHIEVIQPRISDPGRKNDAIAINPGFTTAQYKRLALLYIVASTRKGAWLIPTFHAVLDDGIPDGHDDPQNFQIYQFDLQLRNLVKEIIAK